MRISATRHHVAVAIETVAAAAAAAAAVAAAVSSSRQAISGVPAHLPPKHAGPGVKLLQLRRQPHPEVLA